ncbi:ligand-binding sensor domain-containing protein [Flavihumibacter petaseus]|nr:two-component regulator propeller domain-containing protein [Flavihumibacter petaseus]
MRKSSLLLLSAMLCSLLATAQQEQIRFNLVESVGEISLGKITGITQDPQGYMWFTDQDKNALTRFDGYSMKSYRYDAANPGGPGGSYPETVYADAKGYIWVGYYGMGLDRFNSRTEIFQHYRHRKDDPNTISSDTVNVMVMDRSGKLWVGTHNGLDVIDPESGGIQHFRYNPHDGSSLWGNNVRSLCIDQQGNLWAGTGIPWEGNIAGGLNRFRPETQDFTHYLGNHKIRAIREDSHGNLWVGALGNKLFLYNKQTDGFEEQDMMPEPSSPVDHITFIQEDGAGAIWIGTFESGIVRMDPTNRVITRFGNGQGLLDNSGWQAFTSREGVLWFSTQSSNLYRMDPLKKTFHFMHNVDGDLMGIQENGRGDIWFSTNTGIYQMNDLGKPKYLTVGDQPFKSFTFSRQSRFFPVEPGKDMVLLGGRLYRFDFASQRINAIFSDSDLIHQVIPLNKSQYLMTTASGLYEFNPDNAEKKKVSTPPMSVSALYRDGQGNTWVGGMNEEGLVRLANGNTAGTFAKGRSINTIYQDKNGRFWAGTPNGLIWQPDPNKDFEPFWKQGSPIGSTDINGLQEDENGLLWVSTRSGIFQINKERTRIRGYGFNQGVNPSTLTQAIYRTTDGRIMVGSKNGFYSFVPKDDAFQTVAPQIILRDLTVAGQLVVQLDNKKSIRLNHDQDIFSIGFAGIHFSNPGENTHLYKLEGYDPDWRKAGAERTAYYFNVPPGKYTFRVKVANNEDIWSEHSIPIEIVPAWWTTSLFRITASALLVLLLYAFIRWRTKQQFKRQLEKSQTEKQLSELKRRSSELEMQALRSQMNPHFIFNSLNSINRFILQNNKAQASEYLTKFSRLIRFILQNSEQQQITLDKELQSLELYLELEAVRFDHHFSYTIRVDPFLDPGSILVPPLIIQPYAENAIWHGLMHKEERGLLEIELYKKGKFLFCVIRDDGIGRQQAAALKSKSANTHKSMGMHITAGRIELLKGENPQASSIYINDLTLADGSSGGTEVILQIPLRYD